MFGVEDVPLVEVEANTEGPFIRMESFNVFFLLGVAAAAVAVGVEEVVDVNGAIGGDFTGRDEEVG
jgi:hypothetical protein